MATIDTLQARLAEAEEARHQIAIGNGVQTISSGGNGQNSSVSYSKADLDDLENYIASLKSQIADLLSSPAQKRGPIYPTF